MEEQKVGGDLIVAHEGPEGRPRVLLVHGLWSWHYVWEPWQKLLAEAGYNTFALSLRGRAGSRPVRHLGATSLGDFVQDVQEAVDALKPDILVGHSLGGLLVQKVLENKTSSNIKAAVLLTPAAPRGILVTGSPAILLKQLKYLPDMLRQKSFLPHFEDLRDLSYNRLSLEEARRHYNRAVPDSGRAIREVSLGALSVDESQIVTPILVLIGAQDRLTPVNVVSKIAQKYSADYRVYAHHGHLLTVEEGWQTPAADVVRWLSQKVPPPKHFEV